MIRFAALLAFAATLLFGCASRDHTGDTIQVGKVVGVYVEEYTGVYIPRQPDASSTDKPLWVQVVFADPLSDGRRAVTAMVPPGIDVEPGDMVQLRLAGDSMQVDHLVPEHNRVIALIGKDKAPHAFGRATTLIRTAAQDGDYPL
jgi:hypothetical protein